MQEIITERPNLFEPNIYINFYVELSGIYNAADLENAVKSAYSANEATMSKVVLRSDGVAYYEKITQSRCSVEITQDDWQEIIKVNEKIPFKLEQGELIRCFIIPAEEKISLLIMARLTGVEPAADRFY